MRINKILNEGYGLDDISEIDVTQEVTNAFPPLGELEGQYRDLYNTGFADYIYEFYTKKDAIKAYDAVEEMMNYEPSYGEQEPSQMTEDEVADVQMLMDELENMKFNVPNEPTRAYIVNQELGNKLLKFGEHVAEIKGKIVWGWNTSDTNGTHARPEAILAKLG